MMTCPRNAYLTSKLVSGVRGAWLRRFSLFLGNDLPAGQVALQLPQHNTRPCMSGLDTAAFVSHSVPRCSKKKKSWKTLSQRASLGLFHFLHRCGGDTPPVPLCTSSNVPDWYGWSNDASLSTGIYEHRNEPIPLTTVVGTHSSWKYSVV